VFPSHTHTVGDEGESHYTHLTSLPCILLRDEQTGRSPPGVREMRRRVVVTGGSRGIGRAIVEHFAGASGDEVVAVGRDPRALAEVQVSAANVRGVRCDVCDEAAVVALFDELGPVDVLVNSAGVSDSAPLHRTSLASWDAQMAVNATAVFLCTRAVINGMRTRGDGRIVTVASTGGRVGVAYAAAYAASKHAAIGLMRSAAAELAGTRVTANAVCPAFVDTEMTNRAADRIAQTTGRSVTESIDALSKLAPLGRLVKPEEVAEAVVWLASPAAAAINGQALVLDGGGIHA
jgi:NAD(P)-dependent dehydrogenase (short-subunit alcohol dehydrogenase family)